MSWVLLLLTAWVLIDIAVVVTFTMLSRRRAQLQRTAESPPRVRVPQVSARPTSRLVH